MATKQKTYEPDRQAQLTNTVNSNVRPTTDKYASASASSSSIAPSKLSNATTLSYLDGKYGNTGKAYLPTANATNSTYLGIATSPTSKDFSNGNFQYSAVTANGSSYIPQVGSDSSIYKSKYSSSSGVGGSGGIYGRANFQASQAYNDAMAYTNQLLEQLSSGRTSYTDQINELMNTINNRASFNYDPDNDPLFQQYLASSMESGKTAMTDTMAQASALTGGYGSTYATAAANGAYNNYVQDAYNNLPEYYQTALEAYNSETSNLYNRLNMYNVADETEYNRLANAYQMNYGAAQDMYSQEYNNYYDALNYNTSVDQYNADLAYKYASLAQDQKQYEESMAYQKKQDAASSKSSSKESTIKNSDAYSYIDRVISNSGYDSDEYYNTIAELVNQGYDMDDLLAYGQGGTKTKNYIIGNENEKFTLISGKSQKDDAVYQDAYGNTYTYKELKNSDVDASRIKG